MGAGFTADRRLYRSRDGKIVEEGDPDAVALAYAEGDQVDAETAKANNLAARPAKDAAAKPDAGVAEVEPEHKRAAAPDHKAVKAPQEDK